MEQLDYWQEFVESGVQIFGHHEFASGRHCDEKIEFDAVAEDPRVKEIACNGLARLVAEVAKEKGTPTALVSVGMGANAFVARTASLASEILGSDVVPIRTSYIGEKPRRTFQWLEADDALAKRTLNAAATTIVLEDVINKFTNSSKVTQLIQETGAKVLHIVGAVTRDNRYTSPDSIESSTLVDHFIPDWERGDCYLCPEVELGVVVSEKVHRALKRYRTMSRLKSEAIKNATIIRERPKSTE